MTTADGWLDYWSGDISVYVSERHLAAHYRRLFAEIRPHLPPAPFTLLDYGCGEALMAPRLAAEGGQVVLVDEAPGRAGQLRARFAGAAGVTVADDLAGLAGRCDLALMISVSQYIPKDQLPTLLARLAATLKPGGRLIVGDVLPPDNSLAADVGALFGFAAREGFFLDAVVGLVCAFRSSYRTMRARLGLSTWRAEDLVALLSGLGLEAHVLERNIGHANHRRSVIATRP